VKVWALLVGFALVGGVARGQTDVAASLYGAFSGTVTGNGVTQSPASQAGFMAELHHQSNPLVGYELTYSWNRANQRYSEGTAYCGLPCGSLPPPNYTQYVPANAHEVTADWEVSLHVLNLRPFLLAGGGVLFHQPAGGSETKSSTAGVLVYGGGVDVGLLPHLGLRAQYRGNLYSAPQLSTAFSSTGAFFHTSEPMIGAYFRF
jgi:opacity protein-like surface antigen